MSNLPSGISPVIARWLQVEKGIMLTAENITNANIVIKEMIHLTDRQPKKWPVWYLELPISDKSVLVSVLRMQMGKKSMAVSLSKYFGVRLYCELFSEAITSVSISYSSLTEVTWSIGGSKVKISTNVYLTIAVNNDKTKPNRRLLIFTELWNSPFWLQSNGNHDVICRACILSAVEAQRLTENCTGTWWQKNHD